MEKKSQDFITWPVICTVFATISVLITQALEKTFCSLTQCSTKPQVCKAGSSFLFLLQWEASYTYGRGRREGHPDLQNRGSAFVCRVLAERSTSSSAPCLHIQKCLPGLPFWESVNGSHARLGQIRASEEKDAWLGSIRRVSNIIRCTWRDKDWVRIEFSRNWGNFPVAKLNGWGVSGFGTILDVAW